MPGVESPWRCLPAPAQAELLTHHYLPYAVAPTIAQAAVESCASKGYAESAVVVDRDGDTIVAIRGDNAQPYTMENARRKAYTAMNFASLPQTTPSATPTTIRWCASRRRCRTSSPSARLANQSRQLRDRRRRRLGLAGRGRALRRSGIGQGCGSAEMTPPSLSADDSVRLESALERVGKSRIFPLEHAAKKWKPVFREEQL